MEDAAATQPYFLFYFQISPVRLCSIEVTGSLISKPHLVLRKYYIISNILSAYTPIMEWLFVGIQRRESRYKISKMCRVSTSGINWISKDIFNMYIRLRIRDLHTWIALDCNFLSIYFFPSELWPLLNLCHSWYKWQKQVWIHRSDLKFALAIFKHYWVKKDSILRLFAEIFVYSYVSLRLVPLVPYVSATCVMMYKYCCLKIVSVFEMSLWAHNFIKIG